MSTASGTCDRLRLELSSARRARGFRPLRWLPRGVPECPGDCPIKRALQCFDSTIEVWTDCIVVAEAVALWLAPLLGVEITGVKNGRTTIGITDTMMEFVDEFDRREHTELIDEAAEERWRAFCMASGELAMAEF